MGEGNIIGRVAENGEVTYRENVMAIREGDMEENDYWVPAGAIESIYALVDKKSNNTIAGIGNIEESASQYTEVTIEKIFANSNDSIIEYTLNPDTYVGIEEFYNKDEDNLQKIYNSFEQYYMDRITQNQYLKADNSIETRE